VYGPRVIGQYLRLLPAAGVAWPVTEQGNNRDPVAGCIPALSRRDPIANILAVLARLRRTGVAQLSIACAILLGAMACVYAVERLWFSQRRGQAMSITVLAASASEVGFVILPLLIILLVLTIPITCVYLVQMKMFGRGAAERMQPSIFLARVCAVLECPPAK
jgi:hypothetical protein